MNENLATEIIAELKAVNRRWFIAFITVLLLWFATIGGFLVYMCLPVEENENIVTELYSDDGNANYVGNDMNGVINNGGEGTGN